MSAIAAELFSNGHPCRSRLVEWLREYSEKELARLLGCEVRTAKGWRQGAAWPGEAGLTAMVDVWGAAFLSYVFAPLLESPESLSQRVARLTHELTLAQQEIADVEREIARVRASARPASDVSGAAVSAGQSRRNGRAAALRRASGAVLSALAMAVMLAAPSDDFTRARSPRPPRPPVSRMASGRT